MKKSMYIPVIGLEIHAELNTKSKMFCSCANNPNEKQPNKNTCPICLAHPGTLPTINKEAVYSVLKFGLAINGKISKESHFDRKSYFYPDLPKGYQISQYENPLVSGGILYGVNITRVHLEEDAGSLVHISDKFNSDMSGANYNRAGVPLMELVTEPDIKTADEAVGFAKELQRILRYIGVSKAGMESGEMRIEVNISIKKESDKKFGTKVEVKNLNSFKAVHDSIEYEIKRQIECIENGETIKQETRGWNESKGITVIQRSKESAHDYRYFPEPDLPSITFSDEEIENIKLSLPEMPNQKRERFINEFNITTEQADSIVDDIEFANYFEECVSEFKALSPNGRIQLLANYLISDVRGFLNARSLRINDIKLKSEHFAHLVTLIDGGKLSSRMAKDLLLHMCETGEDPEVLIKTGGVKFMTNESELHPIIEEIIEKNTKAVEDFKKGKMNSLQFLVGQAMAKTRGQADPEKLREMFEKNLSS